MDTPGFQGAPATKLLIISTVAASVASLASLTHSGTPLLARAFPQFPVIGSLLGILRFPSLNTLMFGAASMYTCRPVERYLGQARYVMAVSIITGISCLVSSVFPASMGSRGEHISAAVLVFALAAMHLQLSPRAPSLSLNGWKIRPRVWLTTCLLYLVTNITHGKRDAAIGLGASLVWLLFFTRTSIPHFIASKFSSIAALVTTPVPATFNQNDIARQQRQRNVRGQRVRQPSGNGARYQEQLVGGDGARVMQPRPPTEENVNALIAMGYQRQIAVYALTQTGNDLNAAVDFISANS